MYFVREVTKLALYGELIQGNPVAVLEVRLADHSHCFCPVICNG